MAKSFPATIEQATGFKYDQGSGGYFAARDGYLLEFHQPGGSGAFTITAAVSRGGAAPDPELLKPAVKECKILKGVTVQRYRVLFTVAAGMTNKGTVEHLQEAAAFVTDYLRRNGFTNCCESCGQPKDVQGCNVSGQPQIYCEDCFQAAAQAVAEKTAAEDTRKENVIGGAVGALLGTLIGALVIILIGRLGRISIISGLVMGVCAVKGYELLGGKITKKGVAISAVFMIAMVYLANRVDTAIDVSRALDGELSAMECFRRLGEIREALDPYLSASGEKTLSSSYLGNLGMLYLFTAIGAVPTVLAVLAGNKLAKNAYQVGIRIQGTPGAAVPYAETADAPNTFEQ